MLHNNHTPKPLFYLAIKIKSNRMIRRGELSETKYVRGTQQCMQCNVYIVRSFLLIIFLIYIIIIIIIFYKSTLSFGGSTLLHAIIFLRDLDHLNIIKKYNVYILMTDLIVIKQRLYSHICHYYIYSNI